MRDRDVQVAKAVMAANTEYFWKGDGHKLPVGTAIRFDEEAERDAFLRDGGSLFTLRSMRPQEATEFLQRRCIARVEREMARKALWPPKVNHKARIDARNAKRTNRRLGIC